MKNSEVLSLINKLVVEEKGRPVTLEDTFADTQLDSLGAVIFFCNLEAEFPIEDEITYVDIPTLAIRDLVHKCRLSITEK